MSIGELRICRRLWRITVGLSLSVSLSDVCTAAFSPLAPSRAFALLPSALPLQALWAMIPYVPWTLLLLPWLGHL